MNNFSEESLKRMSHRAKFNESIVLNDLKYILAADESYNEILCELWDILDLNDERNNYLSQDFKFKEANLDSAETRAVVWYYILARIAETVEGKHWFRKLPDISISMFSLYRNPECTKELGEEEERSEAHFVKLDDLSNYLMALESIYEIDIPLPKLLFPPKRKSEEKEIETMEERSVAILPRVQTATDTIPQKNEIQLQSKFNDKFVRDLIISYENDNEIKIQEHGKKPITLSCQGLGFRDNESKAWRTFINILQEPPHILYAGPAYQHVNDTRQRVRGYDRRLKRLSEIDGKLKSYLNQHFKARIPENYKLYEKCKTEKSGTYKFNFRVVLDDTIKSNSKSKYEKLTEDRLIKILTEMYDESLRIPSSSYKSKMVAISEILKSKFRYSETEIKDLLKPENEK